MQNHIKAEATCNGQSGSDQPATCNPCLKYFTLPAILEQIGSTRINRFLVRFSNELNAASIPVPQVGPECPPYFSSAAALFSRADLPGRLRIDLFTLEAAASPHNHDRLEALIEKHIPSTIINPYCPLDRALELWFLVPDSLLQFAPSASASVSSSQS